MDIHAFHLPAAGEPLQCDVVVERAGVRALVPDLGPAQIDGICDALIAARAALLQLPVARVIDALDAAARRLRDPAEPMRAQALHGLSALTGYSDAMAALVLDRMAEDWLAPALRELVETELGGVAALESFVRRADGVRSRAIAPALGLHVFSGNVPGVNVTSIVRALLVRSAVFGKTAAGEPVLAPLFLRLVHEIDPVVGGCAAVSYWPGGDESREAAVLARAGMVVHYGGADAIASLRARAPAHVRFVEHGPRLSFALVNGAAEPATLADGAAALARAVALFDQQGCVSPQLAWVMGDAAGARAFAQQTAAALARVQDELPRGRLDPAEAAAIRELRTRAEFRAIGGRGTALWHGRGLEYTVIFDAEERFEGSCLNRTLLVKPVASIERLGTLAAGLRPLLQTVGLHGFAPHEAERIAMHMAEVGVSRVAPLSAMPWPPPVWHHDGRGPLTELIRWVDLEFP